MRVTLPSAEVVQAIHEAKKNNIEVQGFFLIYDVKINDISIDIEPKEGFKFNPSDVFTLAWYVKEYM